MTSKNSIHHMIFSILQREKSQKKSDDKEGSEYAYTMMDVEDHVTEDIVKALEAIDGVFRARIVK